MRLFDRPVNQKVTEAGPKPGRREAVRPSWAPARIPARSGLSAAWERFRGAALQSLSRASIDPRDHSPGAGAIGRIFGAEMGEQKRFFGADARDQDGDQQGSEQEADDRSERQSPAEG